MDLPTAMAETEIVLTSFRFIADKHAKSHDDARRTKGHHSRGDPRDALKDDAGLTLGDKEDNRAAAEDFRFLRSIRHRVRERIGEGWRRCHHLAVVGGFVWLVVDRETVLGSTLTSRATPIAFAP